MIAYLMIALLTLLVFLCMAGSIQGYGGKRLF
jgi:hypothetical protein